MLAYIPHKNNKHSWKTALFIFCVVSISAVVSYFALVRPNVSQKNIAISKTDNVQVISQDIASEKINMPAVAVPEETKVESVVEQLVPTVKAAEEVKPSAAGLTERNKNPATRLEEAKNYTQPKIAIGKYIDISLKYQNMVIFEDGKVLDAYQISSGKKGMDTPTGTFKVENKSPKAWSKTYSLWMPNWMAFLPSGEMGIHELPIWPGGYQEGANHLGTPVSHGCVRLGVGAAKRVYDWADVGTLIIIHQ